MTSERSQAYGRVMKTLADVGASKLQPAEQDEIRAASDALLFCENISEDQEARVALDRARALATRLVEADRWLSETADALIRNVEACGPVPSLALSLTTV